MVIWHLRVGDMAFACDMAFAISESTIVGRRMEPEIGTLRPESRKVTHDDEDDDATATATTMTATSTTMTVTTATATATTAPATAMTATTASD